MKPSTERALRIVLPISSVVLLLAIWSVYVRTAEVSALVLPPPEAIVRAFIKLLGDPKVWHHAWVTVIETMTGFVLAVVSGVLLGTLMAKVRVIEWALNPMVIALQVVPKIALAPLFILWFGFGLESKIVISLVIAFFPVFANTHIAMKSVDPGDREVFESMRASPLKTFLLLEMPSALPVVLTGMEVAIVLAIIGAVVGEFIGGNEGLGYLTVVKLQQLDVAQLFGVVLLLTLIGLAMYMMVVGLRRLLVPWHHATGAPL
ncbi:MAG: ABC transporter permease [Burkholderiales bacterium]|nr:ABC transporter permease [Burkholderiales bacterium]